MPLAMYRVGNLSLPCVQMRDRRAAGDRLISWIFQRDLEKVLYHRENDGGTSGAIWKLLNEMAMGATPLGVNKEAVDDEYVTEEELKAVLRIYRTTSEGIDPSSLGRIRKCTLLPLDTAAAVARKFGYSDQSVAFLNAFSQPLPARWALEEERKEHEENGELDLMLDDQIYEAGLEAEEQSFAAELTEMHQFEWVVEDDRKVRQYTLERVPAALKTELDAYGRYRSATFAATRDGGAVADITTEADKRNLLRFFGWLHRTSQLPEGTPFRLSLLGRSDLGSFAEEYALWLENTQNLRYTSIANYLNGLVMVTSYVYANLNPPEETLAMEITPLTRLVNLRGQAEKQSRTQRMYDKRVGGGWVTWHEVQQARLKAMTLLEEHGSSGDPARRLKLLRDATAISLLSLLPPDRVGIIRKLRFGHTLKKRSDGGWRLDLTNQRDGHKTSRFYGPFAARLPDALTPILTQYFTALSYDFGGDTAYLFYPPNSGDFGRCLESAGWTAYIKRLFEKLHGSPVAPKTLRAVFITWLRDSTDDPEILKAAAHAQKHSLNMQASTHYDQDADTRLIQKAYDFNLKFVTANYTAPPMTDAAPRRPADHAATAADTLAQDTAAMSVGGSSTSGTAVEEEHAPEDDGSIDLGDTICTLAPQSKQPSAGRGKHYELALPWHEEMKAGAVLEVPPISGLTTAARRLTLPRDVPEPATDKINFLIKVEDTQGRRRKAAGARPAWSVSGVKLWPKIEEDDYDFGDDGGSSTPAAAQTPTPAPARATPRGGSPAAAKRTLPSGWTLLYERVTPKGQKYRRYECPRTGAKAQSIPEAWRKAAEEAAAKEAAAIQLGDATFRLLSGKDVQPDEGGSARWSFSVGWHEEMRAGAEIEVPASEALGTTKVLTIALPNDVEEDDAAQFTLTIPHVAPAQVRRSATVTIEGVRLLPAPPAAQEEEAGAGAENIEGDDWPVDKVLDARRGADGGMEVLLQWGGTGPNGQPWKDSWEPESGVTPDVLEEGRAILQSKEANQEEEEEEEDGEEELPPILQRKRDNERENMEKRRQLGLPTTTTTSRAPSRTKDRQQEEVLIEAPEAAESEGQQVDRLVASTHGAHAGRIAATQVEALAGNWQLAERGYQTLHGACENATQLDMTQDHLGMNDEFTAQVVAAEGSSSATKRPRAAPTRFQAGQGAGLARPSAEPASRPRPSHDDDHDPHSNAMVLNVSGLSVGDIILAKGLAPGTGDREWFQARVMRIHTKYPPIEVKYIATADGCTQALLLPSLRTARVHRGDTQPTSDA